MSEEQILALLKSINIKIEALQAQIMMFQEALQPHREHTKVEESVEKAEVIIQDLEGITILKKLEKSYLVLKKGYTAIVAYSHLKSGDGIVEGFFGNLNDDLFEERKWILKTKKDGTPNLKWQPFVKEEVPPWEVDQ